MASLTRPLRPVFSPDLFPPCSFPPLPPLPAGSPSRSHPASSSVQPQTQPHPSSLNPSAPSFSPIHPPPPSSVISEETTWKTFCFPGSVRSSPRSLFYIAPGVTVESRVASCLRSEVDKGAKVWDSALLGLVVGLKVHIPSLKKFLTIKWSIKKNLEIFSLSKSLLIFKFEDLTEKQRVLDSGPWFIAGHLLMLRTWRRNLGDWGKLFSTLPIWLQLPGLPLEYWTQDSLSRIGSTVGYPLMVNDHIASCTKTSYARICVEISPSNPLPSEIKVDIEGAEGFLQKICYEWVPKQCSKCKFFTQLCGDCGSISSRKGKEAKRGTRPAEKDKEMTKSGGGIGPDEHVNGGSNMVHSQTSNQQSLSVISATGAATPTNSVGVKQTSGEDTSLFVEDESAGWTEVRRKSKSRKPNVSDDIRTGGTEVNGVNPQIQKGGVVPFVAQNEPEISPDETDGAVADLEPNLATVLERHEHVLVVESIENDPVIETANSFCCHHASNAIVDGIAICPGPSHVELADLEPITSPASTFCTNTTPIHSQPSPKPINISNLTHPIQSLPIPFQPNPSIQPNTYFTQQLVKPSSTPKPVHLQNQHPLFQPKPILNPDTSFSSPILSNTSPTPRTSPITPITIPASSLSQDETSGDSGDDGDWTIPPGFTPDKDDMVTLRELMKEGAASIPIEYQRDFVESVDQARDDEILDFFKDKFRDSRPPQGDPNFLTYRGLRRSPRIKRKPAKLVESTRNSGLKKGFLK